eukprot:7358846-Lingulodinium_polyedra.AAC.1
MRPSEPSPVGASSAMEAIAMSSVAPAAPAISTALSGLGSKHLVPCSQIVSFSRSAAAVAASCAAPDGLARPWDMG